MAYFSKKLNRELTFEEYMKVVDRIIGGYVGLSSSDLPDIDYYSHWEDGSTPKEAAAEALEEAGADEFGLGLD